MTKLDIIQGLGEEVKKLMNHKDYWDSRADGSLQNEVDKLQKQIEILRNSLSEDKNIQIGFTVNKIKNTITIKESILNLYAATFKHSGNYKENKKEINKTIKNLIGNDGIEIKGLSGKVSKFLISCIEEKINFDKKYNI